MLIGNVVPVDDANWRRPSSGPADAMPAGSPAPHQPAGTDRPVPPSPVGYPTAYSIRYEGPPVSTPPPTGWSPARIVQPAPPRQLPAQDHTGIDADEVRARTLTLGFALIAGAIIVIVMCALCGRALF